MNKNTIKSSSAMTVTSRKLPKMQYEYENLLTKLRKELNTETEDMEYGKPSSGYKQVKV